MYLGALRAASRWPPMVPLLEQLRRSAGIAHLGGGGGLVGGVPPAGTCGRSAVGVLPRRVAKRVTRRDMVSGQRRREPQGVRWMGKEGGV
jgi:hypothetical protein